MVSLNLIRSEIRVTTARSSGAGGQHVNKVETKVTLRWSVADSQVLTQEQKEILLTFFVKQLTSDGELLVSCETHRSQIRNKEMAYKKLERLLHRAFMKAKPRKPTKPTKASQVKRVQTKKIQGEKKKWRQKPEK